MADIEHPQIYLITPPELDLEVFPDLLARVLDQTAVACVRLALSTRDEDTLARAADAVREVVHARDVAIVISEHGLLVDRLGLDGVHLPDGARSVRKWRKDLGPDAIVGAYCGQSRHDGMNAGEGGADYVAFGPVGASTLGDGARTEDELFEWWSAVIEVPLIAEGNLDEASITRLSSITDFFAIGQEVWGQPDPVSSLANLVRAVG